MISAVTTYLYVIASDNHHFVSHNADTLMMSTEDHLVGVWKEKEPCFLADLGGRWDRLICKNVQRSEL